MNVLNQRGYGIFNFASDLIDDLNPINTAKKIYEFGSNISRGEYHLPQITSGKSGIIPSIEISQYQGPGTQIEKRLKEGRNPITQADMESQAHDIRYSLAQNKEDTRNADNKMINTLTSKISIFHPFESINNIVGATGIKIKTLGEDAGIFSQEAFTKTGLKNESQDTINLYKDKLKELEDKGYGRYNNFHRRPHKLVY